MNQVQRARPVLGTITQISAWADLDPQLLHAAVTDAFAQIGLVHSLMSWHDPASELSRLNLSAVHGFQMVHPHTRAVLEAALAFARLSDGAFDPCVAARLARWGLLPVLHTPHNPPEQGSWRDIELAPQGVRFHRALWLDLGGIAKGYAVDLAVQCLQRHGVQDLVVNAGGDLRVAGERDHPVAIRHPQSASAPAYELPLHNEALASSSAFESRRESAVGAVSALVDPARGLAYAGADSVSVRAPTCMTADALTKVALFAPPALATAVFEASHAHCIRLKAIPTV